MGDVKPKRSKITKKITAADMAVSDFPPPANTDIAQKNDTAGLNKTGVRGCLVKCGLHFIAFHTG